MTSHELINAKVERIERERDDERERLERELTEVWRMIRISDTGSLKGWRVA